MILDDRKWLSQELESLSDVMEVYPSHTNFILVRVADAKEFCQKAKDSGFLLRDVSYQQLLNNCVRITVGNTDQNQKLINGLRA